MNGRRLRLFSEPIMRTYELGRGKKCRGRARASVHFLSVKGKEISSEFARIRVFHDVDERGTWRKCLPLLRKDRSIWQMLQCVMPNAITFPLT